MQKKQRFTYSEVLKITGNYQKVIGLGGFGTVFHGYLDGAQVAVKMLSASSSQGYKEFEAEVQSSIIIAKIIISSNFFLTRVIICRQNYSPEFITGT